MSWTSRRKTRGEPIIKHTTGGLNSQRKKNPPKARHASLKRNKTTRQTRTGKSQRIDLATVWTVYFWRSWRFRGRCEGAERLGHISPYFSGDEAKLMCQQKGFTHCDPRRGLMDERQTWQKPQRLSEPRNSWMELTEEHSAEAQTENTYCFLIAWLVRLTEYCFCRTDSMDARRGQSVGAYF